jgi:hypothetical protein
MNIGKISAYLRGVLRRRKELFFPARDTFEYRKWMNRHLQERAAQLRNAPEPGLLSILTAVWDRSPIPYLANLADSLFGQNRYGHSEWVILDNGCSRREILSYLEELRKFEWIKICRSETNVGITAGLRLCLQYAQGRYVLPIDGDDLLYPDTLKLVTSAIQEAGYPALLYTDEDKITPHGITQPYFKPDWDPVLLANSAYIAHLGVIDRIKALELGAYGNEETEGSPDWDLFVRFSSAGHHPVHIPEVVYSWRVHAHSTADDARTKPYIASSQKAVLEHFLQFQPGKSNFSLQESYLLPGGAHWHFVREHTSPKPMLCVVLDGAGTKQSWQAPTVDYPSIRFAHLPLASKLSDLRKLLSDTAEDASYVCFVGDDVKIENPHWPWEALGLFEMFPDTVMVGGRLWNDSGTIIAADQHFGFGGPCGCPNCGRSVSDPGYFAQMWKQRSVSAVSLQLAATEIQYLLKALRDIPSAASVIFGGAWIGAEALRDQRRVIYTPFLSGMSNNQWERLVGASEHQAFLKQNTDLIPDRRFYPRPFSLQKGFVLEDN